MTKTLITLEPHCLQLPYAHLRLQRRQVLERLVLSIETQGQLLPVVVVPHAPNQWILMDGYLRVNALRRLGKDIIDAEVWDCDVATALLMLLTEQQSRTWAIFEEALLLQELHTQHGFSQSRLAEKMGRDKSWICRRLSLLAPLSESIVNAILHEKLSLWSATRVVAPLARANTAHGECVLNYLLSHHRSTRDLSCFYEHYQRSTYSQRSKMVNDPDLFFKAQTLLAAEKKIQLLQAGPEGQWDSQWRVVQTTLTSLHALASHVFMPHQEPHERVERMTVFTAAKKQFDLLTTTVGSLTDVNERHASNNSVLAATGINVSGDQPVT